MNQTETKLRIASLFPHYADDAGISHTSISVCGNLRGDGIDVRMLQPASDPNARKTFTKDAIPPLIKGAVYKVLRTPERVNRYTEWMFLRSLARDEIVFLWPGTTMKTYRRVKELGHRLLLERINCHTGTAKKILDDAYARVHLPPTHGVTDQMVKDESEELALADFVFAPSPLVEQSLVDHGVPREKILASTYGWDPNRIEGTTKALPPIDGLTVLFVGSMVIRKGAHLLLEAWAKAGINGRLVFAGGMSPEVSSLCAEHLKRPDVKLLGYVNKVEEVFRSADVFVFPSLEEGSPLVMYEAMATRLPVLLSPMAAGSIARHEQDGFVLDPYDQNAWIEALRRLANDVDMRKKMGESARARIEDYTWEKVGSRRRKLLLQAAGKPS